MLATLQRFALSKRAITWLFVAAVGCNAAGWAIGIADVVSALASGVVTFGGAQLITVDPGVLGGSVASLGFAALLIGIGTVAAFVSWAAALRNTWGLEDKAWFVGILGLGMARFGWVALIAYILRGPDAARAASRVA